MGSHALSMKLHYIVVLHSNLVLSSLLCNSSGGLVMKWGSGRCQQPVVVDPNDPNEAQYLNTLKVNELFDEQVCCVWSRHCANLAF